MKAGSRCLLVLLVSVPFFASSSAESPSAISCGQTITEDTILDQGLTCSPDDDYAIAIGASNITLDLGGHVLEGFTPGRGILADGYEGITVTNGTVQGFHDGVCVTDARDVTMENLTVRNLDVVDPDIFIFGVTIVRSQGVVIRDTLFEFPSVFHKEAVEVYESDVAVSNIDVRGGGVGVNFSFIEVCDPVNTPSNGSVLDSTFSGIRGGGVWVACSSSAWIAGNDFSTTGVGLGVGVQGDAPFSGAVTGLLVEENSIRDYYAGIEFRGIIESTISNNIVRDNSIGIMMRQSLGCLVPETGWECFYSTANVIADNEALGNGTDLYHDEASTGNTWERNTCETTQGADIPECISPAVLAINYASGGPGSFFTLVGANFPADSSATVAINGHTLGTVPTDSTGGLVFLLNTDQADEGHYTVTTTVNPTAAAEFFLDSSEPIRPQQGSGPIFNVPGGIAIRLVYVPLALR